LCRKIFFFLQNSFFAPEKFFTRGKMIFEAFQTFYTAKNDFSGRKKFLRLQKSFLEP